MASVNSNVRAQLPTTLPTDGSQTGDGATTERRVEDVGTPAGGFSGGLTSIGMTLGSVGTDAWTLVGGKTDEDGDPRFAFDPAQTAGFGVATVGPVALLSARNPSYALAGSAADAPKYLERFGTNATIGGIRITPTLVSAILGPAVADGMTMVAPNLVKKVKDTKTIKDATEKSRVEAENSTAKITRGAAGGVVVGLVAGAVFLLKPEIFKQFGQGVARAIEGATYYKVAGSSATHKLKGMLDAATIRSTLAGSGKAIADDAAIQVVRTVKPLERDAVFTNRTLTAAAGGVGTLALANSAAGETDPERRKQKLALTAAAALATVGGAYGIGKLTQRSMTIASGEGGVLAKNTLFVKPNIEWIKKYASLIAPITAVPAYTAATQYFNIVNDFNEITSPRSPFRK